MSGLSDLPMKAVNNGNKEILNLAVKVYSEGERAQETDEESIKVILIKS
jgi:hypothetical protein